jgi:hypothetical protein
MGTNQEHQPFCRSLSILFSIKSTTYKKYHLPLNFLIDRSETLCLIQSNETQNGSTNMTYLESAKGITILKARAYKEVKDHGCDWQEFVKDMGDKESYKATHVLQWLGY